MMLPENLTMILSVISVITNLLTCLSVIIAAYNYLFVKKSTLAEYERNKKLSTIECFKEYEHIAQALKNCDCPCVHTYYKAVPCDGYSSYYVPSNKDVRGSFPVTVWWGA